MVSVSFALAAFEPVGVVVVAFSNRLSRVYRWDLQTDTFAPGQFVKARARVHDLSMDGRYVAYEAYLADYDHSAADIADSYLGIAHVPYFTAVAFFPALRAYEPCIRFRDEHWVDVRTGPVRDSGRLVERIESGSRFSFCRDRVPDRLPSSQRDPHGDRIVFSVGGSIYVRVEGGPSQLLHTFERTPFDEVPPPEWAKRW